MNGTFKKNFASLKDGALELNELFHSAVRAEKLNRAGEPPQLSNFGEELFISSLTAFGISHMCGISGIKEIKYQSPYGKLAFEYRNGICRITVPESLQKAANETGWEKE